MFFCARSSVVLLVICVSWKAAAAPPNYNDHIKPLFRDHCLKCHNSDDANADLDLSSFAATMKGGSSGAVVKAGLPESSQLFRAMNHDDGVEAMPPESPRLSQDKLSLVSEWIREGLLEGRGSKSQLRSIAAMASPVTPGGPSPMPENWTAVSVNATVRPPIPQAIAASPGAPLFAVSGQEQVLLFGRSLRAAGKEAADVASRATTSNSVDGSYRLMGVLPFPEGTIHDLKFSRNGAILLVAGGRGSHTGRVVLFDVKTGQRVVELGEEVDSVLAADVSANHKFVALGGPAKIVKIFSTETGELIHRIKKHTDWITAVTFSPDGKLLATGDRSGGVHVWETEKGVGVYGLDEHKVRITSLRWRGDGSIIASAADDGNLILWSMKDGFPLRNIAAHVSRESPRYSRRTGVQSLSYGGDGRLLTTGRDRSIRIWSESSAKLKDINSLKSLPVSSCFLHSLSAVAVGSFDGAIRIYSLETAKPLQTLSTATSRDWTTVDEANIGAGQ